MIRFLTLIVTAATLSLASCASSSQKGDCCGDCKAEAAKKACCEKDKSSNHKK